MIRSKISNIDMALSPISKPMRPPRSPLLKRKHSYHQGHLYQQIITPMKAWVCNYSRYFICVITHHQRPKFNSGLTSTAVEIRVDAGFLNTGSRHNRVSVLWNSGIFTNTTLICEVDFTFLTNEYLSVLKWYSNNFKGNPLLSDLVAWFASNMISPRVQNFSTLVHSVSPIWNKSRTKRQNPWVVRCVILILV